MTSKRRFSHLIPLHAKPISHLISYLRKPILITVREPVPLDPARPSVAQLPDPIVRQILTLLYELDPQDVKIVARLSSSLYEQVRFVQHRDVHLDLDEGNVTHVLHRLRIIQHLGHFGAIRTLRVTGTRYDETQKDLTEIVARLAETIPEMTGLRDVHWNVASEGPGRWDHRWFGTEHDGDTTVAIPRPILEALPPAVQLHTFVFCNDSQEAHAQAREFLLGLVDNQNLYSLTIRIKYKDEKPGCAQTTSLLKQLFLSCPNLVAVPFLDIWYPRGTCTGGGPESAEAPYTGLNLVRGERPQPLEELGLLQYPWGRGMQNYPHHVGYRGPGPEWTYWADAFDWSRLERLHPIDYYLCCALAPKLTALREVTLDYDETSTEFLQNVESPIEVLRLHNWKFVDCRPDMLDRFGATLQRLEIHENEATWERCHGGTPRPFPTAPDLVHLSRTLLHLEHLTLDFFRDDTEWPYAALDAIAAFPRLRTVELWFPLGPHPPAPSPVLTASSARHLFSHLRSRSDNIRRATFHSGWGNFPADQGVLRGWNEDNSVTFECAMVYDGKSADDEGWVLAACPDARHHEKMKLHALSVQDGREPLVLRRRDKGHLRLRTALDGPLDEAEYTDWRDGKDEEELRREAELAREKGRKGLSRLTIGSLKRRFTR